MSLIKMGKRHRRNSERASMPPPLMVPQEQPVPIESGGGWASKLGHNKNIILATSGVAAAVAAFFLFRSQMSKGVIEEEVAEEKKRVRFEDEDDEVRRQRERQLGMLRAMHQTMGLIQKTQNTVRQNGVEIGETRQKMTKFMGQGEAKAGGDEDLDAFEQEQNFDTAFMMKNELDEKRSGLVQLDKELMLQRQHLMQTANDQITGLRGLVSEYEREFGHEEPEGVYEAAMNLLAQKQQAQGQGR